MGDRDEYIRRAAELLDQAAKATGDQRAKLLEMANAWIQLADEGVFVLPANSKPDETSQELP